MNSWLLIRFRFVLVRGQFCGEFIDDAAEQCIEERDVLPIGVRPTRSVTRVESVGVDEDRRRSA